jgi:predicted Zn finger-like uncharacterized protein
MTLAVTTGDLRVGQGYVRCGRCGNVFNALLSLSEEPAAGDVGAGAATQTVPAVDSVAIAPAPAAVVENFSVEPGEFVDSGAGTEADDFGTSTGTFETIVLEGDAITQTEEVVPQAEFDQEMSVFTRGPMHGAEHVIVESPPDYDILPGHLAGETFIAESGRRWPWIAAAVALVLVLGAQAVHHWRNEIATEPMWYGPITRLYAAFGVTLSPRWDLRAYDLRQQGASSEGNIIHIALSLANRGLRAQPLPALRLVLLDRYGKRLAARDLQPVEYLPKTLEGQSFLQADQRIDTEISVQDPGSEPASFELDACLNVAGGGLRCANDSPLLSGSGVSSSG